jgi:hypothetical protein
MIADQISVLTSLRRAREQRAAQALAAAHVAQQQALHVRDQADRAFRSFSVLRRVQEAVILRGLNDGPLPPARVTGAAAELAQLAEREALLRRRATEALARQRDQQRATTAALRDWSQAHRRAEACDLMQKSVSRQAAAAQEHHAEQEMDEVALRRGGTVPWTA